ncbi:PAS domain S-box protein [Aquisphaera insulae]|uniref:PAS domain S-box protein n=1 Tax=Aquisphaera insulae TaxID=2712864 RepID=UPI0013EC9CEC|nr:PAS domain S-box protein [Aquisphaera insulae]
MREPHPPSTPDPITYQRLLVEVEDLRRRLAEAESGTRAADLATRGRDPSTGPGTARERERLLAGAVENSGQAFVAGRPDGSILLANRAAGDLLGYDGDEIRSLNWRAGLIPPDRRHGAENALEEVRRGGGPIHFETELIRKGGGRIPVRVCLHAEGDASCRAGCYCMFWTDLSRRTIVEQAWRGGHAPDTSIVDQVFHGHVRCVMHYEQGRPVDWTYLEVDPAFETLVGLKGLAGKRVREAIPRLLELNPELLEIYGRVAATGKSEHLEIHVLALDMWLAISAYSTRTGHFAAAFRAISERKRAEEAVRRSEEKFRTLFETLPLGILYQDSAGRIIDANPAAQRILGRSREELLDLEPADRAWESSHPDGRKSPAEDFPTRVALQTGTRVTDAMMRVYHPVLQETRWLSVNATPLPEAGRVGPSQVYCTIRDVTETVRAGDALAASEARFRAYIDGAADAVFVHDALGRFLDVNQQACRSLGYTRDELLRMNVMDVECEITAGAAHDIWGRISHVRPFTAVGTHRRKDGSTFPVEVHFGCFELDRQLCYVGLARDVSERKEAERLLKERDELLRMTGEIGLIGGWEFDARTGEGRVTEEVARLHDLEPGADFGVEYGLGFYTEGSRPRIAEAFRTALERGVPYDLELQILTARGVQKDIRTVGIPVVEDGKTVKVRGIVQDISERKRVEAALRQSEERYRRLIETAQEGVWVHDLEGRTTFTNSRMAEMLGCLPGELEGRPVVDFLDPELRPSFAGLVDRRRHGIGETHDLRFLRKDGSLLWAMVSASPLRDDDGRIIGVLKMVSDVTTRHWAQQELQASERKFRALARNIPGVVYQLRFRPDGTYYFSYISPRLTEDYDFEVPLDSLDWSLGSGIHQDDLERFLSTISEAVEGRHDWAFEGRFILRDGRVRWFQGISSIQVEGDEIAFNGLLLDIDVRKAAEEEIRALNATLERRVAERTAEIESMLNHAEVGLAFFDRECKFIRINEFLANISGVPVSDHIGRHPREVYPPVTELVESNVARVFETGEPVSFGEFSLPGPSTDDEHCYLVNFFPVRHGDGAVTSVGSSASDITPIKRVERELAELNRALQEEIAERERAEGQMRRLTAILESSPDFVGMADPELRVVYYNQAAIRAIGWAPGRDDFAVGDTYPPEMVRLMLETALPAAAREGVWRGETDVLSRDGRLIPVSQVILSHHDADGNLAYYSTIMRDISERRALERDLREHSDELARANLDLARASRLKDEFLANMSHELRTPLNGVLSMAQALEEEVYGPVNPDQVEAIHDILSSGRHLLAIITDILDLTRIEAGKLEYIPGDVEIASTCQAAVRMIAQAAKRKRQRVELTLDHAVGIVVTDERRLKQILVNLLSNAVKFTPIGGEIGLEMHGDRARRRLRLTVRDAGIGIAAGDLDRIFEPFTQVDSGLSRHYSGAGLGLALVRRMARLLGGDVTVESEPDRGSRFTVALDWVVPAGQDFPGEETSSGRPPHRTGGCDEFLEGPEAIADFLATMGIPTMIYPADTAALQHLVKTRPSVVLVDSRPESAFLDDLLRGLAAAPGPVVHECRVVLLCDDVTEHEAESLGGVVTLRRPVLRESLRSALSRVQRGGSDEITAVILTPGLRSSGHSNIVLLVEDDAINARGVLDFLQTQGLCLALARDGEEAVRKALELLPRAILMDVHLPGLDGLEAIRRIRSDRSTAAVPIIALTALAVPGDRERCLDAGADAYVAKPFVLRELLGVLRELLDTTHREKARGCSGGLGEPDPHR